MSRSIVSPACYAMLALFLGAPAAAAGEADAGLVRIEQTEIALSPYGHVVLLKAQGKAVPIFVDPVVAQSIHGALGGEKAARPLTHDLMRSILETYQASVTRVVVTLKGATFYGELTVLMRGTPTVFDSRSSDAIALAIHFKAPILVSRELLEKSGQPVDVERRKVNPYFAPIDQHVAK